MPEVTVNLFPYQIEMLQSPASNIVAVLSRGVGKSYSLAFWSIYKLLKDSYTGLLIAPTYNMLRETVKYLLMHADQMQLEYAINRYPTWCRSHLNDHKNILSINCLDGKHHYIKLCSGDNPDSIRGSSADFLAMDECALLKQDIVDIATPCLRGRGTDFTYQSLLCTTPRETSCWLYKRYVALDIPDTQHIKAEATQNIYEFTEKKLEYYKSILTEMMFKREILAEWVDFSSNMMFYAFGANHIVDRELPGKLFISCDQNNINLQTLCGWLGDKQLHVDNEILIKEAGNPIKVAQQFHKLYSHLKVRQVYVYGDRYGSNNSLTSKSTYYEQLETALKAIGWTMRDRTNKKNPNVKDSTELCNRFFEQNQVTISSSCKEFKRHLKEVRWKEEEFVMDKKLLDSGFCDCFRYVVWEEFQPKDKIIATNMF